jgi:hypothetical protein
MKVPPLIISVGAILTLAAPTASAVTLPAAGGAPYRTSPAIQAAAFDPLDGQRPLLVRPGQRPRSVADAELVGHVNATIRASAPDQTAWRLILYRWLFPYA